MRTIESASSPIPRASLRARTPAGRPSRFALLSLALCLLAAVQGRAELQFDVFVGFDDRVREGNWFPVAFEIFNDGPTFNGTVVIGPDGELASHRRSFSIELPSGTRKRTVIPVFAASGRLSQWEAQLLDPKGKILAERTGLQPRNTAAHVPILGALPRTFGGLPTLPEFKENRAPEFQPSVARLQSDYFPANPLTLEALTACYLNSERASDLKPEQVDALVAWLHAGGHLIIGIEQPADITALPWLRGLMPFVPAALTNIACEGSLERWLITGLPALQLRSAQPAPSNSPRNRRPVRVTVQAPADADPDDPFTRIEPHTEFNNAEIPVLTGRVRDGKAVLSLGNLPLIVSAPRGRGTLTALAFSPEREPFRSWNNRPWFWAKLVPISRELLSASGPQRWGGTSLDGLFGAMLDSRQVRKLPVAALLLLLVVYLGVIGPFDQWILRRTGKQMWTWVTFPTYVVLFSGLIYFIGYRLRAGDLEWNELQVVDQLPRGEDGAVLRGRTWFCIYSPANARYRLASSQNFATLRSEFLHSGQGRSDSSRLNLRLPPRGFEAEAYVPVWVNQLYASDWLEPASPVITGRLTRQGDSLHLLLENPSDLRFDALQIAFNGSLYTLPNLNPGQRLEVDLDPDQASSIEGLTAQIPSALQRAQQRRSAFGDATSGQLDRRLANVVLASLTERVGAPSDNPSQAFIAPSAFDVNHLLDRGDAVLFAWASSQSIAQPIYRFSPSRMQRDVVVRLELPVDPKP